MIHALDHVMVAVGALDAAVDAAATLLGRPCDRRGEAHGMGCAWFAVGNTSLLLVQSADAGAGGDASVAAAGFAVAHLGAAGRLLARRGVSDDGAPFAWAGADGSVTRAQLLAPAATNGLSLLLVERAPRVPEPGVGLDHLVIRTRNPDRAVALFGGRLGLDLRLDRSSPEWGTRFLFFRCGDLVVEVTRRLAEEAGEGPDGFAGLAWRAPDIHAEHARLAAAGVVVSEMRPGRKPGSHVFTVRDRAALVPSIFIGTERAPYQARP